jgi:integrase
MKWVNNKEDWLFGDVEAYSVTGWFTRYSDRLGISPTDEYGNTKTFHSLRHTFITKVRNIYPNLHHIQQVVGHRIQKADITDKYTHGTNDLACLIPVIDSFIIRDI